MNKICIKYNCALAYELNVFHNLEEDGAFVFVWEDCHGLSSMQFAKGSKILSNTFACKLNHLQTEALMN